MDVAVIIGTSGWQYRDWRGRFYPAKLPQRLWLEHYAQFFATVESNNAFYRLPEHATFVAWRESTSAYVGISFGSICVCSLKRSTRSWRSMRSVSFSVGVAPSSVPVPPARPS